MKANILFLDDDQLILQSLKRMLHQQTGAWNMHFMDNADQAYSMLVSKDFSVIVCDIAMPVIDGITFIELCRKAFPLTTRIMLTGFPSMDTAIEAVNRGQIYAYLNKPVDINDLVDKLTKGIGHYMGLRELEINARYDGLTGLLNRKQLDIALSEEIVRAQRYKTKLSILMLDIDHFKNVNDLFGHITGDSVLKEVAATIKSTTRKTDICGRYGGEEFLVILPETDLETGFLAAGRIRKAIEQLEFKQDGLRVTISGGLAALQNDDLSKFLVRADHQLYISKENGRNQINGERHTPHEQHLIR